MDRLVQREDEVRKSVVDARGVAPVRVESLDGCLESKMAARRSVDQTVALRATPTSLEVFFDACITGRMSAAQAMTTI